MADNITCPHCGSSDAWVSLSHGEPRKEPTLWSWYCGQCGAMGSYVAPKVKKVKS